MKSKMKLRIPTFSYPGGKARLAPRLCRMMPKKGGRFVDVFAGRGNVTWAAMRLLDYESFWLNDIQSYPFFEALRLWHQLPIPERTKEVYKEMKWRDAKRKLISSGVSGMPVPPEEMKAYVVLAAQNALSVAGIAAEPSTIIEIGKLLAEADLLEAFLAFSGGSYQKAGMRGSEGRGGVSRAGFAQKVSDAGELIRTHDSRISKLDYHDVLAKLTEDDFAFIDPPYANAKVGTYGWEIKQNIELRDILLDAKFKWMLTEYNDPIYRPLTKRFGPPIEITVQRTMDNANDMGGRRRKATECVWRKLQ